MYFIPFQFLTFSSYVQQKTMHTKQQYNRLEFVPGREINRGQTGHFLSFLTRVDCK